MRHFAYVFAWLLALAALARAQEVEHIAVRVISVEASGDVVIDRGERDLVLAGDRVVLRPRTGGAVRGVVREVFERSARVEIVNALTTPTPGTRGEVTVPRARLEARREKAREPVEGRPETPAHPPWANRDEDYAPDQPLLAQVGAVRPSQRGPRLRGRVYEYSHQTWSSLSDRGDSFHRLGTDLEYSNPWGYGGSLHFDGELNFRHADLPGGQDENEVDLRFDRLSYRWGGHRFERDSLEAGRFLSRGMPELGVLDGIEWIRRTESNDRFGASLGFLPELNTDYATFEDLQVAAFYEWVVDAAERLRVTGGVQKTFHHGDADRDLVVTKLRYDPLDGWSVFGIAWIDYYTAGDQKGPGFELTQGLLSLRRDWGGSGVDLSVERSRFADIDRFEFVPPIDPAELIDDRYDRAGIEAWKALGEGARLTAGVGAWEDEDDRGYDGELTLTLDDVLFEDAYGDVSVFGTQGEFTDTKGARFSLGKRTKRGRWSLAYEVFDTHLPGFDFNDIVQHRLRVARDHYFASGWSVSAYAQAHLFDEENAWTLGLALEKSF